MKPRALYRWKSFWLGVLVLACLGWAWWLSYGYLSMAAHRQIVVWQGQGYVSVGAEGSKSPFRANHERAMRGEYIFQLLPPPFIARGGGERYHLADFDGAKFREREKWSYSHFSEDYWGAYVPHWLVMLVFLGPWVGFLGWRWRRMRGRGRECRVEG